MPINRATANQAWEVVISITNPMRSQAWELEHLARADSSFVSLVEAGFLACEAGTAPRASNSPWCEQRRDQVRSGAVRRHRQTGQSRLRMAARLRRDVYDRFQHFASRWGAGFQPQTSPDRISVFIQRAAVFVANDVRALAAITRSRLPRRSRGRTDRSPRRDQGALLAKPKWHALTRMRVDLSRMDKGGARIGSGQMRGTDMSGMGLWDPRKPFETWPEPVIFRPDARRLYRGDPQQLRNAVRMVPRKTVIQTCNQRSLTGLGAGYIFEGVAAPPRPARLPRLPPGVRQVGLSWDAILRTRANLGRISGAYAEADRRYRLALQTNQQVIAQRWKRQMAGLRRVWVRTRSVLLRDLAIYISLLRVSFTVSKRRGPSPRLDRLTRDLQRAISLRSQVQGGPTALGACCAPCDAGQPCASESLGFYGRNLPRASTPPPGVSQPVLTVQPVDVIGWSCVEAEGLMKVRVRSGRRIPWSALTNENQDAIMNDPALAEGFTQHAQRCNAAQRDPAVQRWAARQRAKTAEAHALVERQHPEASYIEEVGKQAGALVGGAGEALTKGAGAAALAFLKTAWPVLLGGGVLWWAAGSAGRKAAAGYAGRGARTVGRSFRNVGAGVAAKVRRPRENPLSKGDIQQLRAASESRLEDWNAGEITHRTYRELYRVPGLLALRKTRGALLFQAGVDKERRKRARNTIEGINQELSDLVGYLAVDRGRAADRRRFPV